LISVLIANFNNGHFIKEAIDSVINQTYGDWEIIIVDDSSTDNSRNLLEEYTHSIKKITFYFNEINKGCGFAKNKAVELSVGEYAIFLDPDDTLAPSALEKLLNIHENNPDCSIAYATNYICDESLKVIRISDYPGQVLPFDTQLGPKSNKIGHPALFKKSDYNKTTGININLQRAVDQDLYAKLEEVGTIIFLNEPLHYYRQHRGSISLFDNTTDILFPTV